MHIPQNDFDSALTRSELDRIVQQIVDELPEVLLIASDNAIVGGGDGFGERECSRRREEADETSIA